eukprot:2086380-Rhodomonas_salina.1
MCPGMLPLMTMGLSTWVKDTGARWIGKSHIQTSKNTMKGQERKNSIAAYQHCDSQGNSHSCRYDAMRHKVLAVQTIQPAPTELQTCSLLPALFRKQYNQGKQISAEHPKCPGKGVLLALEPKCGPRMKDLCMSDGLVSKWYNLFKTKLWLCNLQFVRVGLGSTFEEVTGPHFSDSIPTQGINDIDMILNILSEPESPVRRLGIPINTATTVESNINPSRV